MNKYIKIVFDKKIHPRSEKFHKKIYKQTEMPTHSFVLAIKNYIQIEISTINIIC